MQTTVDISRMGNLLNMSNIFSMFIKEVFASPSDNAKLLMKEIRNKLSYTIRHFSYEDVNALMDKLKNRTSRYSVLTRTDIEKSLEKATPFQLLSAAAIFQDESPQSAMLFLLHPVRNNYKGKELLMRFGFIDNAKI